MNHRQRPLRFEVIGQEQQRNFAVVYRSKDCALDSVPPQTAGGYSLNINDVQLELSASGLVNYVWGYCPRASWQTTRSEPPPASPGELRVAPMLELVPGVSICVSKRRVPVYYNEGSHWLCLGNPLANAKQGFCVRIAPSIIIVGNSSHIFALWVKIARFEP